MIDKQYKYLLLDLDGTITDPWRDNPFGAVCPGAFWHRCYEFKFAAPVYRSPLKDSFQDFTGLPMRRQRLPLGHRSISLPKGSLRTGCTKGWMPLASQLNKDRSFYVATSKPEVFAVRFWSTSSWMGIYLHWGSTLTGSRSSKTDVIRYVMDVNGLDDNQAVVMIGDRKHDMVGAGNNGIDAIGCCTGGDEEELPIGRCQLHCCP